MGRQAGPRMPCTASGGAAASNRELGAPGKWRQSAVGAVMRRAIDSRHHHANQRQMVPAAPQKKHAGFTGPKQHRILKRYYFNSCSRPYSLGYWPIWHRKEPFLALLRPEACRSIGFRRLPACAASDPAPACPPPPPARSSGCPRPCRARRYRPASRPASRDW